MPLLFVNGLIIPSNNIYPSLGDHMFQKSKRKTFLFLAKKLNKYATYNEYHEAKNK